MYKMKSLFLFLYMVNGVQKKPNLNAIYNCPTYSLRPIPEQIFPSQKFPQMALTEMRICRNEKYFQYLPHLYFELTITSFYVLVFRIAICRFMKKPAHILQFSNS